MSGEPKSLTPPWAYYRRTGLSEMRPYVPKEPLATISVSAPDMDTITRALTEGRDPGGYVARNPKNHADQWYVAQAYFNENLEPADTPARDDAAELRAENDCLRAECGELREQLLTADFEANTWQDRVAIRAGTEVKLREEISRLRAVIREWYESNQALDAFIDPPRGTAHTRSYRDWRDTERRALDAEDAISRVALEKEYNMFHKESTVTTRKTHQCEGCGEDIESGAPGEAFAGGSQRAFAWETQQEEFNRFLLRDNTAMRKAGGKLATAALHVVHEYDGLHRLMLAVSEWSQVVADEGGRATEKTEKEEDHA